MGCQHRDVDSPAVERTRPKQGDELELRVDTLAYGGNGVARLDGYVLFVPATVPGDRIRARVTKRKRALRRGRVCSS